MKGEQRDIGVIHHFDSSFTLDIEELDKLSTTDKVGTLRLTKNSLKGERTQRFNEFEADYRMRFELLEWLDQDKF